MDWTPLKSNRCNTAAKNYQHENSKILCKIGRNEDVATFLLIEIANKRVALFGLFDMDLASIMPTPPPLSYNLNRFRKNTNHF